MNYSLVLLLIGTAFAQQGAELFGGKTVNDATRSDAQRPWATGPALLGDLVSAQVNFDWRDQCWGNKKGRVYLKCSNGQSSYLGLFTTRGSACYRYQHVSKKVTMNCPKGSKLSLTYTVGGGGGHRIYLKNLKCTMKVKEAYQVTVPVPTPPGKLAAGTKNDYSSTNSVKTWGSMSTGGKKATSISGSFRMKDQCWGNAKGRVYVSCNGAGRKQLGFYSPSYRRNYHTFSFNTALSCSSTIKIEYVVGGGGGHRIYLSSFSATVKYAAGSKKETRYREKDQSVVEQFTLADMVGVSEQTWVDMDNYYKAVTQAQTGVTVQEWESEALFIGMADVEQFDEQMDATKLSYFHMAAAGALAVVAFVGGRISLRARKEYEPLV